MDSENGCMAMTSDQNSLSLSGRQPGSCLLLPLGPLGNFHFQWPYECIVLGAEESSRGLWNMSPGFWSYFFLWADFSEFGFTFKTGNTEPDSTSTLTHLPEVSQIRKQQRCPKGPGAGLGVGRHRWEPWRREERRRKVESGTPACKESL